MEKKSKYEGFPTQYSESVQEGTFQTFNEPSMTEPDNAMSIPEIIARFTRGYGLQVQQHDWVAGSASEGGERFEDSEDFFDEFMPAQQPAQQASQEPAQQPEQQASHEPAQESEG